MTMNPLLRTLLLSLLLHWAAFAFFVKYAATGKERPVVIEMSLSQLPGGSKEEGKIAAEKGAKAAPAADRPGPPNKGASPQQIKPAAGNGALTIAAQQAPQAAPRLAPTAPVLQAQAQQSRETGPPAGKQAAGSAATPGSTGGEPGKSGLGGTAGPAGGASGGRGSGSGSGNVGGNGRGNSSEHLQKKYHSENFAYILKIIQDHIVYPNRARREGLAGKAFVSFVVLENGQVAHIKLLRSTGYEILDLNLIKTIKAAAPFPKPPIQAELQMALSYTLEQ